MEKLYIKKKNGRYEEYGFAYNNEIPNGIWMVESKPGVRSTSGIFWKIGDIKKITDVTTHAAIQSFGDELATYLVRLRDENSQEYKVAKSLVGGYLHGPVSFTNISASDLVTLFLRQISLKIEEENGKNKDR